MELTVKQFDDFIIRNCLIIANCHEHLLLLLDHEKNPDLPRSDIDRNLVRMSVATQRIMDLVSPVPSTGEIFGLPREATTFGNEPDVLIVDREHPKWDFRPWFTEKASVIRDSVNQIMDRLEDSSSLSESGLQRSINSDMAEIENKAHAILSMIESGRLTVTDVRIEEEDE